MSISDKAQAMIEELVAACIAFGREREPEDVETRIEKAQRELREYIDELEAAQRWRVVANGELPEEDGEYWVWFDDEFTGIKISGYCDYSKQNGWDNTERVTHWMPLPPNPESPNDTQTQTIVYGKEGEE